MLTFAQRVQRAPSLRALNPLKQTERRLSVFTALGQLSSPESKAFILRGEGTSPVDAVALPTTHSLKFKTIGDSHYGFTPDGMIAALQEYKGRLTPDEPVSISLMTHGCPQGPDGKQLISDGQDDIPGEKNLKGAGLILAPGAPGADAMMSDYFFDTLSTLFEGRPLHISVGSCFAGLAIKDTKLLPAGSTVTALAPPREGVARDMLYYHTQAMQDAGDTCPKSWLEKYLTEGLMDAVPPVVAVSNGPHEEAAVYDLGHLYKQRLGKGGFSDEEKEITRATLGSLVDPETIEYVEQAIAQRKSIPDAIIGVAYMMCASVAEEESLTNFMDRALAPDSARSRLLSTPAAGAYGR